MAKPRKKAMHAMWFSWVPAPNDNFRQTYDRQKTACDKLVDGWPYKGGKSKIHPAMVTTNNASVSCAECRRQVKMTPGEHRAYMVQRAREQQEKFAKFKTITEEKRKTDREAREALVATMRDDALVMMDCVLSDQPYEHADTVMYAAHQKWLLASPKAPVHEKSAERRYVVRSVFGTRRVCCRFCGGWYGLAARGANYNGCWFSKGPHGYVDLDLFWSEERAREKYGEAAVPVSVDRHHTLCALAYLADVECPEKIP